MKIFLLTNLFLFALLTEKIYSENFLEEQENVTEIVQDRPRRSIYSNKNLHCGSMKFNPKPGTAGKWLKNNLTYYIGSYSSYMKKDETKRGIRSAFNHWSAVVPLTFTEVDNEPADIWIGFRRGEHGDGLPFDGRGGQIAHCSGQMPCTAIHFDDDEDYRFVQMEYWLESWMVDFISVAMHQIGHALGLGHYDENENNIMNSRYHRPATKKGDVYLWPNLKPVEIKAVKDLYGISTEYPYVGCYVDGKDRLLNNPLWMYEFNEENSVFHCSLICSRDGFRYAGVENENQCFCGNELNLNTSRKSSDETICQEYNCPGNNLEFCGGVRAIAVYDTAPQNSNGEFAQAASDLFDIAIPWVILIIVSSAFLVTVGIVIAISLMIYRFCIKKEKGCQTFNKTYNATILYPEEASLYKPNDKTFLNPNYALTCN